eukprot:5903163-Pleurochrysis_carterae.AAC.2
MDVAASSIVWLRSSFLISPFSEDCVLEEASINVLLMSQVGVDDDGIVQQYTSSSWSLDWLQLVLGRARDI